jgi:hypothetical protein
MKVKHHALGALFRRKRPQYPLNGSQYIRVNVSTFDLPNKDDDDVSRTFGLTETNGNSFTI